MLSLICSRQGDHKAENPAPHIIPVPRHNLGSRPFSVFLFSHSAIAGALLLSLEHFLPLYSFQVSFLWYHLVALIDTTPIGIASKMAIPAQSKEFPRPDLWEQALDSLSDEERKQYKLESPKNMIEVLKEVGFCYCLIYTNICSSQENVRRTCWRQADSQGLRCDRGKKEILRLERLENLPK